MASREERLEEALRRIVDSPLATESHYGIARAALATPEAAPSLGVDVSRRFKVALERISELDCSFERFPVALAVTIARDALDLPFSTELSAAPSGESQTSAPAISDKQIDAAVRESAKYIAKRYTYEDTDAGSGLQEIAITEIKQLLQRLAAQPQREARGADTHRTIKMLECSLRDYMHLASEHELTQFAYYGPAKDALEAAAKALAAPKPLGEELK